MAKVLLLIVLVAAITTAEAAAGPSNSPAEMDKYAKEANVAVNKILDDVIASTPPAREKEAIDAVSKARHIVERAVAKAVKTGSVEKVRDLAFACDINGQIVMKAPPAEKLERMEQVFNEMAAPDRQDCPNVDRPFCETVSKLKKASKEVSSAVARGKGKVESIEDILLVKKEFAPAMHAINKAYADGDGKEIAMVLATYSRCADAILAAAPAEKFKVTQETMAAASGKP